MLTIVIILAWADLRGKWIRFGEIAARVGYRSEAAFSKAFKRLMGVAPVAYRGASGQAADLFIPDIRTAGRRS
ncbi:MAG: AraC family transcriptional regulator [Roseiflexus sp.]|nr:AraC family transcriptional regulator [Roseiflexus sp.]